MRCKTDGKHEVLAKRFGPQGLFHAVDVFVRETGNFLDVGALHHAQKDGQLLHSGGLALEEHSIGGRVPAQEDAFRVFQKMLQKGLLRDGL